MSCIPSNAAILILAHFDKSPERHCILSQLIFNLTKLQERESNDKLKKERDSLQNFLTEKEKRIEQYFQIIKDLEQQKNKVSWHLCTNVHLSFLCSQRMHIVVVA